MRSDVVLINPPTSQRTGMLTEHLGLAYLAAVLSSAGIGVSVIDCPLVEQTTVENLWEHLAGREQPRVVGITVIDAGAWQRVSSLCHLMRREWPGTLIVLGGYFATFWHDRLAACPEIDAVVRGEGERTLLQLVQRLLAGVSWTTTLGITWRQNSTVIVNAPQPLIESLDELPFPVRQHLPKLKASGGIPTIYGSRGCYYQCTFCQVAQLYQQQPGRCYRSRSVPNILDEIGCIQAISGPGALMFTDDEFIGAGSAGRRRARTFVQQIEQRGLRFWFGFQCRVDSVDRDLFADMQSVGLRLVSVGLESMVSRSLDLFGKRVTVWQNLAALDTLAELGIDCSVGFILFDPQTTLDELAENVAWLRVLPTFPQSLTGLSILRGTPLESHFREKQLLNEGHLHLHVPPQEPAIRSFEVALRRYAPLYWPVTSHLIAAEMRLLTQFGLDANLEARTHEWRRELRELHLYFLDEAIRQLRRKDDDSLDTLLRDMESAFQVFTERARRQLTGVIEL